jgi:hypothetical protein
MDHRGEFEEYIDRLETVGVLLVRIGVSLTKNTERATFADYVRLAQFEREGTNYSATKVEAKWTDPEIPPSADV